MSVWQSVSSESVMRGVGTLKRWLERRGVKERGQGKRGESEGEGTRERAEMGGVREGRPGASGEIR